MKAVFRSGLAYSKYLFMAYLFIFGCPLLFFEEISLSVNRFTSSLIMVWIFAMANLLVTGCRYLSKSEWSESIISFAIFEMYGFILFAQHHLILSAVILAVIVLFYFVFGAFLMNNKKFERKIKNKNDRYERCFSVSYACMIFVLMFLLAVPSLVGVLGERVSYANIAENDSSEYVSGNHSENEPRELSFYHETVIQLSEWDEMATMDRIGLVEKIAKLEIETLGIPSNEQIKVYAEKMDSMTSGAYSDRERTIKINISYIAEASMENVLQTVLHESFHAYEYYIMRTLDFDLSDVKYGYYYTNAREWKANNLNYINGKDDYEAYVNQPLERDANAYAKTRLEEYNIYLETQEREIAN